ncbi:hypothetical protein L1887_43969 [Cichorium endivia]|nr:hypothetical protein L1887_43969 [Cichorium endivia]
MRLRLNTRDGSFWDELRPRRFTRGYDVSLWGLFQSDGVGAAVDDGRGLSEVTGAAKPRANPGGASDTQSNKILKFRAADGAFKERSAARILLGWAFERERESRLTNQKRASRVESQEPGAISGAGFLTTALHSLRSAPPPLSSDRHRIHLKHDAALPTQLDTNLEGL